MDNFGNRPNLTYIPTLKLVPTLPAVYGDELSYYEALAHLQASLNNNTEELSKAFEQVYNLLIDGIGSGVAINYETEEEDIEFVVSSDIKPEEPIDESITQAIEDLQEADDHLAERITREENTRATADDEINETLDTVAPATYADEIIKFGGK